MTTKKSKTHADPETDLDPIHAVETAGGAHAEDPVNEKAPPTTDQALFVLGVAAAAYLIAERAQVQTRRDISALRVGHGAQQEADQFTATTKRTLYEAFAQYESTLA